MSTSAFSSIADAIHRASVQHKASEKERLMPMEEFFEERINIKSFHNEIIPLKAKPIQLTHQKRVEQALREGKKNRFLLLKYRRGGFTTWEQAKSYRTISTRPNTTCVTLADTKDNAKTIFKMVKLMLDRDAKRPPIKGESKTHIEFPSLNSSFLVGTAGTKAFGRGDNIARVHGSEVAFWSGDKDQIDNLIVGLTEAARHGQVMLETTANGAKGWFYETYKEAMAGNNEWIPLFYAWYMDEENVLTEYTPNMQKDLFDTMTVEERKIMEDNDLSVGQMLWRRMKQRELKKMFKQEYPENWLEAFLVRGNSFFDSIMLDELSKSLNKPLHNRENVVIWEEPITGHDYCAGADTAEGNADSDNSVMGILDKVSGKQVAILRGKWRPEVFARKCIDLCKRYNNAMYACEVNNHGHSVMNTVVNTLKYKKLYHRLRPIDKNKYGTNKKEHVPGWNTNASTRPILLDDLNEALEEGYMEVNDPIFISECKTFVDIAGKYQAAQGENDDTIIAWGIAWQCRTQKKKSYLSI